MPTNPDALALLSRVGVLSTDQPAILTCSEHQPPPISIAALHMNTEVFARLCHMLAVTFSLDGIHSVVGYGPLAEGVASHLSRLTKNTVGVVNALSPISVDALKDARILVVTENVTTGVLLRRLARLAQHGGASYVVAGALITHGLATPESLGVKHFTVLVDLLVKGNVAPGSCMVCRPQKKPPS